MVTATNNGPNTATGVQVTDKIPAGLTFNSYTASQGTYNSSTGIWNVGTLINGASAILQLFVTPTASVAGTTVTNTATSTGQTVNAVVVVPATHINQNTSPVATVSINVQHTSANNSGKNTGNNSTATMNSETSTIPLQHTGVPIAGLILAILMVFSGSIMTKLKK